MGCKWACDLLEIKGASFRVVDLNQDVSGGVAPFETECLRRLKATRREVVLPQIFVDGQILGNVTDLQELEDDSELEDILCRRGCPSCSGPRNSRRCKTCGTFALIMPGLRVKDTRSETESETESDVTPPETRCLSPGPVREVPQVPLVQISQLVSTEPKRLTITIEEPAIQDSVPVVAPMASSSSKVTASPTQQKALTIGASMYLL